MGEEWMNGVEGGEGGGSEGLVMYSSKYVVVS